MSSSEMQIEVDRLSKHGRQLRETLEELMLKTIEDLASLASDWSRQEAKSAIGEYASTAPDSFREHLPALKMRVESFCSRLPKLFRSQLEVAALWPHRQDGTGAVQFFETAFKNTVIDPLGHILLAGEAISVLAPAQTQKTKVPDMRKLLAGNQQKWVLEQNTFHYNASLHLQPLLKRGEAITKYLQSSEELAKNQRDLSLAERSLKKMKALEAYEA